jgi:hypothetical protein
MASGRLEAVDLDGLRVNLETLFLIDEEFLHNIALIALELDHVASLVIVDDGAVAGELLLDDLEDLFEVELGWDTLDGGQGFTTITLLDTDVDV